MKESNEKSRRPGAPKGAAATGNPGGMALQKEQQRRALHYTALFWFLGAAGYLRGMGLNPEAWVASCGRVAARSSLLLSQAGTAAGVLRELAVVRRSVPGAAFKAAHVSRDRAEADFTCWAEGYQDLFQAFKLPWEERCRLCQSFYRAIGGPLGVDIQMEKGAEACRLVVSKRQGTRRVA